MREKDAPPPGLYDREICSVLFSVIQGIENNRSIAVSHITYQYIYQINI